jgi:L-fuconolactonase
MIFDAYLHLWQRETELSVWIAPDEPTPLRNVLPNALDPLPAALSFATGLLMQAADNEEEVPPLSAAIRALPQMRCHVAQLNLTLMEAAEQVAAMAIDPAPCGFRSPLGPTGTVEGNAAMAEVDWWGRVRDELMRSTDLSTALWLAQIHPDLRLGIEDAVDPDLKDPGSDWAVGLRALTAAPDVAVEQSELKTRLGLGADPATIHQLIGRLVNWLSPYRLLWSGDLPAMTWRVHYGQWLDRCQAAVAWLGAADLAAIFGTSAMCLFRVADHDKPFA